MGQLYPEEVCNENWRKAVYFGDLSRGQCVNVYFISACGSCQGRLLRVRLAEKSFSCRGIRGSCQRQALPELHPGCICSTD